jgi:hypothetical protein
LGHDLLELLLLISEAVLLLVITLIASVILIIVVVVHVGGVELHPLGAIGDEVGSVAALEVAPR